MKQTARIISTYAADVSGVCSALYELGGMTIMHDASGCNSTYNTHDEPRWYDMDSMVYISGLSEMEALMGDDEKLCNDIVDAAKELAPAFIAVAGTPVPMMIGTDFHAIASVVEARTGIKTFGFDTNGMASYCVGASLALKALAAHFVKADVLKTNVPSVNLLGLTPLDFSTNGSDGSAASFFVKNGIEVVARFAMGDSLETLCNAKSAWCNVVLSEVGLSTALYLKEQYGMPFVVGQPIGTEMQNALLKAVLHPDETETEYPYQNRAKNSEKSVVLIGEAVSCGSLAKALSEEYGLLATVVNAVSKTEAVIAKGDFIAEDEDEIIPLLKNADIVIADPLYRPIVPAKARFVPLPHEAFSGRIYRKEIPDLIKDFDKWKDGVM